ncbi:hypothetical protein FKW77_004860 [Venturia effusa]|uniref:Uncharacterized protein n=1 Tax=Venturia effusa TaxID=50376 RepID=A0A517KZE9_9PEZI|nr:hypothetical protein FKW77_004860 [Venturia effusa]
MAWNCNKEQHQNSCPDYSVGPACFGTMSWGHCDRGCAESVHVADGTWCSGNGVVLALGMPTSAPGSQHPAPPPVPYNAPAALSPNTAAPTPNPKAGSNVVALLGSTPPPSSSSPPPPKKTPEKGPDPPKTPDPTPGPPKTTPSPPKPETKSSGSCHKTKPDPRVKQTTPYALCL